MENSLKPFLTGSYVYGYPTPKSDIDIVVYLKESEILKLMNLGELDRVEDENYRDCCSKSIKFGKLNLICVNDEETYEIWKLGTEKLKEKSPVPRDFACKYMQELRDGPTKKKLRNDLEL